eukprot:7911669-Alexandrium_andersonii.AAC.1
MSASLVGSEMCIRDRSYVIRRWVDRDWGSRSDWSRQLNHVITDVKAETVSYTHLTLPTICSV